MSTLKNQHPGNKDTGKTSAVHYGSNQYFYLCKKSYQKGTMIGVNYMYETDRIKTKIKLVENLESTLWHSPHELVHKITVFLSAQSYETGAGLHNPQEGTSKVPRYPESVTERDLPTDSMRKSKLSSEASFLLDFSFPCKFTIFTNS